MKRPTREAVERAMGAKVLSSQPLSGGDINEAFSVDLSDARRVFVKQNAAADPQMFPAEARGLDWLREAGALRIPEVLAVSSGRRGEPAFLVLELLEPGPRRHDFDDALGQGLAALHRFGAPGFGLDHDNFIGRLPQSNSASQSWGEFYRERRLEPQLELAARAGLVGRSLRSAFERLFVRLDELVSPAEPPHRLHGDLWGGNLHVDSEGAPCLIDPAVYGGHREMDLAMMRLFGGFSSRVFSAYEASYPLAAGAAERVPLYQLYPLLVHVNLFGAGYVGAVERAVSAYA